LDFFSRGDQPWLGFVAVARLLVRAFDILELVLEFDPMLFQVELLKLNVEDLEDSDSKVLGVAGLNQPE